MQHPIEVVLSIVNARSRPLWTSARLCQSGAFVQIGSVVVGINTADTITTGFVVGNMTTKWFICTQQIKAQPTVKSMINFAMTNEDLGNRSRYLRKG